MAQGLMASLVGYLTAGFFLTLAFAAFLHVLLAIVVALVSVVRVPEQSETPAARLPARGRGRWGARPAVRARP